MKYNVTVTEEDFEVEIRSHQERRWEVRVNGCEYTLDIVGGHVLCGHDSLSYHCLDDESGQPRALILDSHEFAVRVEQPRRASSRHSLRGKAVSGTVPAPMNGQVVKVLREAGATVQKGDVILVLEAMKMENEVASPAAGRLVALHTNSGATVKPGEPLFTVDTEA